MCIQPGCHEVLTTEQSFLWTSQSSKQSKATLKIFLLAYACKNFCMFLLNDSSGRVEMDLRVA